MDYGAVPNDNNDDSIIINQMIKQNIKHIFIPSGIFNIETPIILKNDVKLTGAPDATITASKKMKSMISMVAPSYIVQNINISSLVLDANNLSNNCINLYKVSGSHQEILKDVRCRNALGDG